MPQFRDLPLDAVIDVRSFVEFWLGHLDGATNIPVDRLPRDLDAKGLKKDSRILVYCASGGRSAQAAAVLAAAGYTRVMDGGGMSQAQRDYRAA